MSTLTEAGRWGMNTGGKNAERKAARLGTPLFKPTLDRRGLIQYVAWRRSVPYTDLQIEGALTASLASCHASEAVRSRRAGILAHFQDTKRLSIKMLLYLAPWLATTCCVCGAVAHYRQGWEGLCRFHKDHIPASTAKYQRWWEQHSEAREMAAEGRDRDHRTLDSLRQLRNSTRRRK